ncbi:TspO/MBR family protein [Desulfoplanes formicivorans]|uniref:Tryptophan-rich sensory protein n=1 Tax=Desulfoplanes formicivorans TaxID=1592317 RepID=A0A194AE70_9BACT|nr:TspO/MBR family protein [Desulfoplanes formicivorans]GAU07628.1 hypothetical protein DPF_0323 [Desulfoplanes formicivorans]
MKPASRTKQLIGLVGWLAVCFAASAIGAWATMQAGSFYTPLIQPAWAPPSWLFGPVWTVLYALMALAAWMVWCSGGFSVQGVALWFFLGQLLPNALWSWIFFTWHLGLLAFADIVLLWLLIAVTLVLFWRVRPLAGALLIPYLLWVGFAAFLNYALWQLNPTILG